MKQQLEEYFSSSLSLNPEMDTKMALAGLPARRGLLLFADADHRPIQLLMSADIRRTARARLASTPQQPRRKAVISNVCRFVYNSYFESEFACLSAYVSCCKQFFKEQLDKLVQLPKLTFVKLETRGILSFFSVTEKPGPNDWGPFVIRKNATHFADIFNFAFGLCRNPECLSSGRFDSCPYYQMNHCPGPCIHSELRDLYQTAVHDAIQAATSGPDKQIQQKQTQMQSLAKTLDFEKARCLRDQIESLKGLMNDEFRYVHSLSQFRFLHIDRYNQNKQKPLYSAFILDASTVTTIIFGKEDIEQVLLNMVNHHPQSFSYEPLGYMAIAYLLLHRKKRPGIWLDCSKKNTITLSELRKLLEIGF